MQFGGECPGGFASYFIMTVVYFNVERLGQPEELMPLIKPYYLVLLASLVFVMSVQWFQAVYGRYHRHQDRHVDTAGRKRAEHHR